MSLCWTAGTILSFFPFSLPLSADNVAGCRTWRAYYFRLSRVFYLQTVFLSRCQMERWQKRPFSDKCTGASPRPQAMFAWQWRSRDFRHGGRKEALSLCPLRRSFDFPAARCVTPHTLFLFLSASPHVWQCSYAVISDDIGGHLRCRAKVTTGLGTEIFLGKISTLRRFRKYFLLKSDIKIGIY